jgi:hypothetical protein
VQQGRHEAPSPQQFESHRAFCSKWDETAILGLSDAVSDESPRSP